MSDFPVDTIAPASPQPAPVAPPAAAAMPVITAPSPAAIAVEVAVPALATPIVTINSSPVKALLLSLATGLVHAVGAFLMTHGALTQVQADTITPIVAQEIVGTALLVGGQCWASIREWLSHQKVFAAALAQPSTIVVK